MTNRDWQRVSQGLGVALVVLIVSAITVVALRSTGAPGATPAGIALASPSGAPTLASDSPGETAAATDASPSPTPRRSRRPSPTPSASETPAAASPSESALPTASPVPSPPPTPKPPPATPLQTITIQDVGLDDPGQPDTTSTARTMRFVSEGPGTVTAQVIKTSAGPVRLCLQTSAQPDRCARLGAGGALIRTVAGTTKVAWVASVINLTAGVAPNVVLKLSFRAKAPSVTLSGFPFLGTSNPGYNGIDVKFAVAPGIVDAAGSWDGNPRPWSATLLDQASGERIDAHTGTGNRADLRTAVGKGIVNLTIENTQDFITDARVFLQTVISWP